MNVAFYSSSTGMIYQLEGLNVHANNVANVNTNGFKAMRPSFSDCLYTTMKSYNPDWQEGHGGFLQKTDLMFSQGNFTFSDSMFDFALPNDGFFALQEADGEISYTRDGAFHMSNTGEESWQLVNSDGKFVLDYEGNRIDIPFDEEGGIDYPALYNSVGVYAFPNPYGLNLIGSNRMSETLNSGQAVPVPDYDKVQGALELSNVDYASEIVHIIEVQRAFQMNSKIVQTADEMQRIANTLR